MISLFYEESNKTTSPYNQSKKILVNHELNTKRI